MELDKLFGSKTKVDILKYLLFRRQWVSMRALESELSRTFPAIKKQIDSLMKACIIDVDKQNLKRSISLQSWFEPHMRSVFMHALKTQVATLFDEYQDMTKEYYLGKVFGAPLDMDLVVVYQSCDKEDLEWLKLRISDTFKKYYIEPVTVTFMSAGEREKRYRLADKFVLNILRGVEALKTL